MSLIQDFRHQDVPRVVKAPHPRRGLLVAEPVLRRLVRVRQHRRAPVRAAQGRAGERGRGRVEPKEANE